MKYVKLFESQSLRIYKVDFTGGGDGVYALYINDKLQRYGDYYHDKIEEWIVGFLDGIKYSGTNFTFKQLSCKQELVEQVSELGSSPPTDLSEAVDWDPLTGSPA